MEHSFKIAIVTNIIANYREDFYDKLFDFYGASLQIFCQREIPGMNLISIASKYGDRVRFVRAFTAKNEKIGIQLIPFWELLNFDVIFFYGNPRIVSNIFLATLLKILGKKIIIWGQARSAGASPFFETLRLGWWRFFDQIFLYTDNEIASLRSHGFCSQHLAAMNNGLNQKKIKAATAIWPASKLNRWKQNMDLGSKPILLSCARLTPKNQFHLAIQALSILRQSGIKATYIIIGDGEAKFALESLSIDLDVAGQIIWCGQIYGEENLAPWFLSADIFIHPGIIGLSLHHAMGYGLPVITHNRTDLHMPEFAVFEEGRTGITFNYGHSEDLSQKIQNLLTMKSETVRMGQNARKIMIASYNTDVMSNRFIKMAADVFSP